MESFEKSAHFAKRIRGQLITYAKHHHDAQPRVFSFQLFLFGEQARIIRWDRTGALVTTPFQWTNGTVLPDFLARFDAASPKQRGADTTARPASPEEITKATDAFMRAGVDDASAMTGPYYSNEVSTEALGQWTLSRPGSFIRSWKTFGVVTLLYRSCLYWLHLLRCYDQRRPFHEGCLEGCDSLRGRAIHIPSAQRTSS